MKIEGNSAYEVLRTEQGYNEGDKFMVHDMDGDRRWIEFDNGCPFWEDPKILESLDLRLLKKGEF